MKDSGIEWIGEIPEAWEVVPLFYCVNDVNTKNQQLAIKHALKFTYGEIVDKATYDEDTPANILETIKNYTVVKKEDIIINGLNLAFDFVTQRVGEVKKDGGITSAYMAIRPNDKVISRYLTYLLKTYDNLKAFHNMGGGVRKILNYKELSKQRTLLPTRLEQQQIANFLDRKTTEIDGLIDKINAEIDILKQYQSSVITRAVTKGLDPSVPMKDSGIEWIGEIPETWKVPKLKHLLLEPMKYGATESGVSYSDKLPRYIRITDITLDGNLKDIGKLSLTEQQAKNYILDDKNILFARSGATVGKTFFYRSFMGKSAFAGYLISAKIDEKKLDPKWVYYFTQTTSYMTWINNVFSQSTIQNISAEKYSNLPISMTYDIKEQRRIIDYLDNKVSQIKKVIKSKQQQINQLIEYKNSLIFEYVTGKKQVKEVN